MRLEPRINRFPITDMTRPFPRMVKRIIKEQMTILVESTPEGVDEDEQIDDELLLIILLLSVKVCKIN